MSITNKLIKRMLVILFSVSLCFGKESKKQFVIEGQGSIHHLGCVYTDKLIVITVEKDSSGIFLKLTEVLNSTTTTYRLDNPYFTNFNDPNMIGIVNFRKVEEDLYISDGSRLMHYQKKQNQYQFIENNIFGTFAYNSYIFDYNNYNTISVSMNPVPENTAMNTWTIKKK